MACWGGDSFPLVLICAVQPSKGNRMPLFDETGAPWSQLLNPKKLVLTGRSALWECCCILLAAGVGHPPWTCPVQCQWSSSKTQGLRTLGNSSTEHFICFTSSVHPCDVQEGFKECVHMMFSAEQQGRRETLLEGAVFFFCLFFFFF